MATREESTNWSELALPPGKAFTAEEMAQAGGDAPSPTLAAAALLVYAFLAFLVLLVAPASRTAALTGALVALAVVGARVARWLWWRPWRGPMRIAMAVMALALLAVGAIAGIGLDAAQQQRVWESSAVAFIAASTLLLFLVMARARQIKDRLRDQAERHRAIDMARRLAAAQLEPHFLFNTLSSLQHWVQTGDPRAAPLLASLTAYLRATLPLFDKPWLAATQELEAVENYLRIMQARLGEARLAFHVDVQPDAARARIAPGLLLTLVENAVEHGVEPLLAGGRIEVRGTRHGDEVSFEVTDNGPGPAADTVDGVGLANARERLALTAGPNARLTIGAGPAGGCRAEVRLPYTPEDTHA